MRRSTPEEDFLWTMSGIQTLLDQQSLILSEYKSKLRYNDVQACLTIPRPKMVRKLKVERGRRKQKVEELKNFQQTMDKTRGIFCHEEYIVTHLK